MNKRCCNAVDKSGNCNRNLATDVINNESQPQDTLIEVHENIFMNSGRPIFWQDMFHMQYSIF